MAAVKDNRKKVKGIGKRKDEVFKGWLPLRGPVKVRVIAKNGKAEKGAAGDHGQKEKEVVTRHTRGVRSSIGGADGRGEIKPEGAGSGKGGALKELGRGRTKGEAGRPGHGWSGIGAAKEKNPGKGAGGFAAKKGLVKAGHYLRVRYRIRFRP